MNKYFPKKDLNTTEATTLCFFPVQIMVLWNCDKPLPPRNKWPSTSVPLTVTEGLTKVRAADFFAHIKSSEDVHASCQDCVSWFLLRQTPAGVYQVLHPPLLVL